MGVSKTTLICLIFVLIFSVFFARLSNMITVSDFPSGILNNFTENEGLPGKESLSAEQKNLFIDDSFEHLLWFVQVSDIHISIFHDPSRSTQFKEFCDLTIDAIKPSVVLASGDLTDAKSPDNMGSRQYIQEWETYSGILQECQINNKTVWLDIRGNHDNFNVPSLDSKENYYRNYSIQGPKHPKSYLYQVSKGGEKYSFIAMDACLEPGPRRPFNFVGLLTHEETEHVSHLADVAKKRGGNYTIWFGHYPTSCILSPGEGGVRSLLASHREGLAYLCGHFHTLGGTVPNMYTLQQAGFLELELGDWKDNRLYRIAAIDHGLFSFVDVAHREWPVILVTNPKHALFKIPSREPLSRMVSSTHIRLLVFSISSIVEVKLKLDEEEWRNCTLVEGPLYVTPWNATSYMTGVHYIYVEATDENGRSKSITQPFSLDGSRLTFQLLPRIVLMSNVSLIFQFMFGIMLATCVLPLCVFRYLHKIYKVRKLGQPKVSIPLIDWWLRKFWILSTVNRIYYPLVLYSLYLSVGPWSVGEVIDGYTGIIFAWGTIIDGVYLPGSFTYAYGFLHMFTFQFPLTVIMAHSVDKRLRNFGLVKPQTAVNKVCHHAPFFLLLAMQMMYAYFFWLAYGTMAFLLGPMRTWSMLLAIYLWWQVSVLPDKCFKEAFCVWSNGNYPELTPEESQRIKES